MSLFNTNINSKSKKTKKYMKYFGLIGVFFLLLRLVCELMQTDNAVGRIAFVLLVVMQSMSIYFIIKDKDGDE